MRRRDVITLLGGAVAIWPLATRAQQPGKVPRVGWMWFGRSAGNPRELTGFRQGLRELGYIEGQNIEVEYRFGEGKDTNLPDLALELVRRRIDVFVVIGTPALRAAHRATTTIPIVSSSGDPVGSGFAASLARPGGNITGMSMMQGAESGLGGKWVELLKDALPALTRVGYLFNSDQQQSVRDVEHGERAAKTLNVAVRPFAVRRAEELEGAVAAMAREGLEALVVDPVNPAIAYQAQVAALALKHRLSAISEQRSFVESGGLLAFGASIFDVARRLAHYMDRILKGTKPGDLPIERPTKFELMINIKTAKALGITIPESIMLRADEVIE